MKEIVHYAQNAVKALTETLPFPVSFTDENGIIISDSNPNRIGTLHSPSIKVMKDADMILFEPDQVESLKNVLPGVAVPLYFDNRAIGVLGIVGDPKEVQPYAKLVKRYAEMIWQESRKMQAVELKHMKLESFLHYILLNNQQDNHEQIKTYSNLLGIDTSYSRICIIIDIGHYILTNLNAEPRPIEELMFKDKLLNCVDVAFGEDKDNISSFLTSEKMILLKPIRNETSFKKFIESFNQKAKQLINMLKSYHISEVKVSVGSRATSLFEVFKSYQEAERLLAHGDKMKHKPQILTYYDWDVLLKVLPSQIDSDFKRYIRDRLYDFFEDENSEELSNDFLVYCRTNMNISQAAKRLYIHRNTLMYRLNKIETLTGLNTNDFEHCMILYFILRQ